MIPTVSELFGLKHFGLFYNFMSLGYPLGVFLFLGLLAGYVYDNEAAKQQVPNLLSSSSISCLGPNCFRLTFLVLAGACGLGSILSIILTMRCFMLGVLSGFLKLQITKLLEVEYDKLRPWEAILLKHMT